MNKTNKFVHTVFSNACRHIEKMKSLFIMIAFALFGESLHVTLNLFCVYQQ